MATVPPPARTVLDEAMSRVSDMTLVYLDHPSEEKALAYARAFAALRVSLVVLERAARCLWRARLGRSLIA
jgi:hypothetical protein